MHANMRLQNHKTAPEVVSFRNNALKHEHHIQICIMLGIIFFRKMCNVSKIAYMTVHFRGGENPPKNPQTDTEVLRTVKIRN